MTKLNQLWNILPDDGRKFTNPQAGRVYASNGLSPTIQTNLNPLILLEADPIDDSSVANNAQNMVIEHKGEKYELRIRRLSCRELFRLQGVPEWAIDRMLAKKDGKRLISDCQCQKMAGNSLVPHVVAAIFERLLFNG